MDRHTRQSRLANVGPDGQTRIARARVEVPGRGLASRVAARYLAGAGIGGLRVADPLAAAEATAADASVPVEVVLGVPGEIPQSSAALLDPAAQAVADGARMALRALRAALEGTSA